MPGFSFISTLLAGLAAWALHRSSRNMIVVGSIAGGALVWIGVAADVEASTTAGLFSASVTAGPLLAGALPARREPVLAALVLLAAIDLTWIASGGGAPQGWMEEVANLTVDFGGRTSSIGTLDLVIAAALTAHWLRRGAAAWLAVAPGPIGMALSNVYVALTGVTNLALVPFLLVGSLITEGLESRLRTAARGRSRTGSDAVDESR